MDTAYTPSPEAWDAYLKTRQDAHVLQSARWGQLKSAFGWEAVRLVLADDDRSIHAGAQLLLRPLPLHLGKLAYLPMGPYCDDPETYAALWQSIHRTARQHGARFLKWEPGLYLDETNAPDPATMGFRESVQTVQPPRTVLLDINTDDDAIMGRMNQGTRRKVRQGYKKGVRFFHGERDDVEHFGELMQTTGSRNAFSVHSTDYYQMAYDLFVSHGDGALILAEHDGDLLAGLMVFAAGETTWYFYGASSDVKRNLMATYGIQWEAIQWAKAQGCRYYDLWGVPDEDEATLEAHFQERTDGLWGVYGFKRGFGGTVMRSLGTWDYVYNPPVYAAYRAALRLRG